MTDTKVPNVGVQTEGPDIINIGTQADATDPSNTVDIRELAGSLRTVDTVIEDVV